jgi:hypothetical protein
VRTSRYEQACQVKYAYGYAIDRRDWTALGLLFAGRLVVDFRDVGYQSVLTLTRGEWIAEIRKLVDGLDATSHQISSVICEPEGDGLLVRSCVTARHQLRASDGTARNCDISGWYTDRMTRVDGAWRIAQTAVACDVVTGDRSVLRDAISRARR